MQIDEMICLPVCNDIAYTTCFVSTGGEQATTLSGFVDDESRGNDRWWWVV